jgi:hypothetical protein
VGEGCKRVDFNSLLSPAKRRGAEHRFVHSHPAGAPTWTGRVELGPLQIPTAMLMSPEPTGRPEVVGPAPATGQLTEAL